MLHAISKSISNDILFENLQQELPISPPPVNLTTGEMG